VKVPIANPFDFARCVVMGHRGAPLLAPENTPASFAAAADAGAAWVELDVRRSADGLVVAHDPVTAAGRALVEQPTAGARAEGIWPLAEVLDGLPAGLGVDVEVKNLPGEPDYDETDAVAAPLAPLLRAAGSRRPLIVSSFNPSTLAALAAAAPEVPRGLLHGPSLRAPAGLALARELGAAVLCSHVDAPDLDAALVGAAHAAGLAVLVWTVDDPARARAPGRPRRRRPLHERPAHPRRRAAPAVGGAPQTPAASVGKAGPRARGAPHTPGGFRSRCLPLRDTAYAMTVRARGTARRTSSSV
jgi:glycerophosphoryl diester phosphodiesterase